jgi:hypothetical protein
VGRSFFFDRQYKNNLLGKWVVNGTSVRGPAHLKSGTPNQDSLKWVISNLSDSIILSIADGHGGSMHFRSNIGSKLAVNVATSVLDNFFSRPSIEISNVSLYKDAVRFSLPRLIVNNWIKKVDDHVNKYPFSEKEIHFLSKSKGPKISEKVLANPKIAYGSTLLVSILTGEFVVFMQIGDGDILVTNAHGNTFLPLDRIGCPLSNYNKSRLSLSDTESLCMDDSWLEFRTGIFSHCDLQPQLILLTTDGYSNSFGSNNDFFKIGSDYLDMLKEYGFSYLVRNLGTLLRQTSIKGSGDDITMGFMYNLYKG